MKRFLFKLIVFISIFLLIRTIPNVICEDFIYFRFWERYGTDQTKIKIPFFLPNLDQTISEEGDLNHGMNCSTKKNNHWFTDKYGLRNKISIKKSNYIIVGCSNTLGSFCDYKNTFSGILSTKYAIYNISPDYSLNIFKTVYKIEKPKKIKQIFLVLVSRYFTYKDIFKQLEMQFDKSYDKNNLYVERIRRNDFAYKMMSFTQRNRKCKGKDHYYGYKTNTTYVENNINTLKERFAFVKNIQLNVIVIPEKECYSNNDITNKKTFIKIIKTLKTKHFNVINISNELTDKHYFHGDSHINEKGHLLIATKIDSTIAKDL